MFNYNSLEIEQNVLGAFLKNNQALGWTEIEEKHFYSPKHGELFAEIKKMYLENGAVSWPDLGLWAQSRTFIEDGDGVTYPRDLLEAVISSQDHAIKHQTETLIELWRKREAYQAAQIFMNDLNNKPTSQALSDFVKHAEGDHVSKRVKSGLEIREEIVQSLEIPSVCVSTGIRSLDEGMAGGMYQGFTYGLCGAEKSGKTTLAHTISYNLAKANSPHLYVAMEMGPFQIEQKNLAREKGFNSIRFLENRSAVKEDMTGLGAMEGLFYLDAPGFTHTEILHHVALSIAQHGIKGFIIDYWQLVQGQERGESEERHLRRTAQAFADFARKNKVWCVLLAQMNKDGQLFGGNGLRKACDQLYMIEQIEKSNSRWLRMDASRYTLRGDIGSDMNPAFCIETKAGPYFREF